MGYHILPSLGTFDILPGAGLPVFPTRAVLTWLAIWGVNTALLRLSAGEPFAEAVERAGNFGTPLALLMIHGEGHTFKEWFARVGPGNSMGAETSAKALGSLRVIVFMLLAGHVSLNSIGVSGLLAQYARMGFANPAQVAHIAGVFETLAAISVLVRPICPVPVGLVVWKMTTELFYPQWEIFEWIERGGRYRAILASWFTLPKYTQRKQAISLEPSRRQSVS